MQKESEESNFGDWVEEKKLIIGSVLVVLIIVSGSYLLWRENYFKPEVAKKLDSQSSKIMALEGELNDLKAQLATVRNSPTTEVVASTSSPASDEAGKVAGASTKAPNVTKSTLPVPVPGKINLNSATITELDSLPGIGPTYAQRIIDYRGQNGGFKSIEDVKNVKGIGEKTFEKFRDKITVN